MGNHKNHSSRKIYKWAMDEVIRVEVVISKVEFDHRLAIILKELYSLFHQLQKNQSTSLIHQINKPNSSEIKTSEEEDVHDGKDQPKTAA